MDFRVLVSYISEWMGAIAVAWLLSLSPRFQRPQIGFLYARRDGFVALSLYAIALAFAFVYYGLVSPVFPDPLRIAPAPVHELKQALLPAALTLLTFITALIIRKQPVRSAGWNPPLLVPALQMGVAIGILTIFLHNRVLDVLGHLTSERLLPLILALGIGLAEETVFRGYIQLRLSWWLGTWPGLVLTSLMFALWHLPAWLHLSLETLLILFGLTFVEGLVLGWVMRKSNHVAAPALYRAFSIWMAFFI